MAINFDVNLNLLLWLLKINSIFALRNMKKDYRMTPRVSYFESIRSKMTIFQDTSQVCICLLPTLTTHSAIEKLPSTHNKSFSRKINRAMQNNLLFNRTRKWTKSVKNFRCRLDSLKFVRFADGHEINEIGKKFQCKSSKLFDVRKFNEFRQNPKIVSIPASQSGITKKFNLSR